MKLEAPPADRSSLRKRAERGSQPVSTRTLIAAWMIVLVAVTTISIVALKALTTPDQNPYGEDQVVTVIVSTERIEANKRLDPFIGRGVFQAISVPSYALVEGAVTDVIQMEGTITTVAILKNEQISTARLTSNCCIDRIDQFFPEVLAAPVGLVARRV